MHEIRKYFMVLKTGIASAMEYRTNFIVNTLLNLVIGVVVQLFLWQAVYGSSLSGDFASLRLKEMLVYIGVATVCASVTRAGRNERQAADEIRNGDLNKYLLKPISHLLYSFALGIGDKISSILVVLVPSLLVGIPLLLSNGIQLSVPGLFLSIPIIMLAIIINFLMGMAISYCAFWFDEVWTLHVVKDISLWFLSGQLVPLSALPGNVRTISELAPFQYLAYVPAGLITGIIPLSDAGRYLFGAFAWTLILSGLTMLVWRRGMSRYGAFGG